ncbi:MAG: hypothetical protein FWB96_06300 [Defluviitaleaceae bacterium]|nr:hypothetical protein [Defluviitaleaceae bacterium]MCL2263597.1 hypothetical protein [Defluviitaleaceae bacterium]
MEKTYKLLDHESPLPIDEIRRLYKGYWVYLVKTELDEYNGIVSGIPVVIGARPYDGTGDGIYKKYKTDEYVQRVGLSLLPNRGFISALRFSEKENA